MSPQIFLLLIPAAILSGPSQPDRGDINIMAGKIDIQKYTIAFTLHEQDSSISATTEISFHSLVNLNTLRFNLNDLKVSQCLLDGNSVPYDQRDGNILITSTPALLSGTDHSITVVYSGKPLDGLIIGTNKYHHFCAFSDNWPNRARSWFPAVDHPSDKALAVFRITVPKAYEVIANGTPVENIASTDDRMLTYVFEMDQQTPTYCMAVGIADFAITKTSTPTGVPLYYYTFPEDSLVGVRGFAHVPDMMHFYDSLFGPYPFSKLALVQSSTIFGGMENSSAIFLPEDGDSYKRSVDNDMTVAHEIAHQWFGDDVTEARWSELWLSEGFATYFSAVYMGSRQGKGAFNKIMAEIKTKYLKGSPKQKAVIDTTYTSLMELLNYENYDKGALFLNALRSTVGDANFFKGIRAYYQTHEHGNATTSDFQHMMETSSGLKLGDLFRGWLYTAGLPEEKRQ